jgi:hypothetical protein
MLPGTGMPVATSWLVVRFHASSSLTIVFQPLNWGFQAPVYPTFTADSDIAGQLGLQEPARRSSRAGSAGAPFWQG